MKFECEIKRPETMVWVDSLSKRPAITKCNNCTDGITFSTDGKNIFQRTCNFCKGEGKLKIETEYRVPAEHKITRVIIEVEDGNDPEVSYQLEDMYNEWTEELDTFQEYELFFTEEECRKECDISNSKLGWGDKYNFPKGME